jgi:sugar fermentation stimulation protein A
VVVSPELLKYGPGPGSEVLEVPGPLSEAVVRRRVNRFLVELQDGRPCHLHDPGRLQDLIYPGARVLVRPTRGARTSCSVTASWAGEAAGWVLIDSRFHSDVAARFLPPGAEREVRVGRSRLDFRLGDVYVEVKGCTLARGGVALFPDAPTERGARHVRELEELASSGHGAMLMVLDMRSDATCFSPNWETDPKFAGALLEALRKGVALRVLKFAFRPPHLIYIGDIGLCPGALFKGAGAQPRQGLP